MAQFRTEGFWTHDGLTARATSNFCSKNDVMTEEQQRRPIAHADQQRVHAGFYGSPVISNLAPKLFAYLFPALGFPRFTYPAIDCSSCDAGSVWQRDVAHPTCCSCPAVPRFFPHLPAVGFCLTTPLKSQVMPHLDRISDEAKFMSSVNTTYFEESDSGILHVGTNTDWLGVRNALLSAFTGKSSPFAPGTPTSFPHGIAAGFVVGAGPAAAAAIYALFTMNLSPIYLLNRDTEETDHLRELFPTIDLIPLNYGWRVRQAHSNLRRAGKVLVAGVGAIPSVAPRTEAEARLYRTARNLFRLADPPTPAEGTDELVLPTKPVFVDMVYRPKQTLLRLLADAHNWSSVCGVEVVLEGSFEQARFWTGTEVDAKTREGGRKLLRDLLDQQESA